MLDAIGIGLCLLIFYMAGEIIGDREL